MEKDTNFIERLRILLEDCDWEKADKICNNKLNEDAYCAYAYLGILMAENKISNIENLDSVENLQNNSNFKRALMYADDELKNKLNRFSVIKIQSEYATVSSGSQIVEERNIPEQTSVNNQKHSHKNKVIIAVLLLIIIVAVSYHRIYDFRSAETLYELGKKYSIGEVVPSNYKLAFEYLKKAADKGHAEAQEIVGSAYFKSENPEIPKDLKLAEYYLKKAADQGGDSAQCSLAQFYNECERYSEALFYFKLAAEKGNSLAQALIGTMYATGVGIDVELDSVERFDKAIYYLSLAEKSGNKAVRPLILASLQRKQYCLRKQEEKEKAEKEKARRAAEEEKRAAAQRAEEEKRAAAQRAEEEKRAAVQRAEEEKRAAQRAEEEKRAAQRAEQERILVAMRSAEAEKIIKEMVKCPAGSFEMGSPSGELGRWNNEKQHHVTISKSFYIAKYPVTQAQYKAVMGNNPSHFKGDNNPVECVSWFMAKEFCDKLNEVTGSTRPAGYKFDLPTEAQWEYACRAGTTTSLNSGKNITSKNGRCSKLDEVGWYHGNSEMNTHPVGLKKPNAWGIYDMHGNVWEWCSDWYGEYPSGISTDPEGPVNGSSRVYRGGSWRSSPWYCRSARRDYFTPDGENVSWGFRIALVPSSK